MSTDAKPGNTPDAFASALVAVIDVGSNSVRMVIYSSAGRAPVPVFNERTLCGLARGLALTGCLDPEGVILALRHLRRFVSIGRAMGVGRWEILATEAVRAATDGKAFVAAAEEATGFPIHILNGDEEAEASALGVVSGIPAADGLMGDLGGGSLEIVALDKGVPGARASLPLGSLRFTGQSAGDMASARARIDEAIESVGWLSDISGRQFYPVGGAWRAFASVHMGQHDYPLHVIHEYEFSRSEALDMLRLVSRMSPGSLARLPGVSQARLSTLPIAAVVMERLLLKSRPSGVTFSVHGLREGWLYRTLDTAERALDPLLVGCTEYGARQARFMETAPALIRWIAPLFANENPSFARLCAPAAHLSDVGWRDHPDYRAEDTFARVLHLPLSGISHEERAHLAFAVSARYGGGRDGSLRDKIRPLIGEAVLNHAILLGRALRFALTLSGGARDILEQSRLVLDDTVLALHLPDGMDFMMSDVATSRFESLARRLGKATDITS